MIVKLIKWLLGIGYLTDDNLYFFFNKDNAKNYSSYTYLKGENIDYKIKFFSWKKNQMMICMRSWKEKEY